ncbi:transcriptional co-activator [Grosmannia clavigera kw1407]|uniref:Transcriptional co-activator n=1 Tax=Grosmannia clavigera (strain kw1407 / UAMH 11150) TaxID=655863 RepID=F0XGS5_GROCL|nr:transcriptional co-activator [Grosmannia clavigera kw1407]EFX02578.1 transcriptional co-activator [Grosmannia clavigera kw1407]
MPDINPADLSRPSIGLSTPILANKSITVSASSLKPKTSQIIPPRIELEPAYTALKAAVGSDHWKAYKDATTQFLIGRLNQAEYAAIIDPILMSPNGDKEHLHNQLVAAIYGNVTREMPDMGLAPWVSANDKPSGGLGGKPASGDAKERRLKGEIMLLPNKDRRRIKDLVHNDFDPYDALSSVFTDQHRSRPLRIVADVPNSAGGGINRMNLDLEIKKRYAQPLAVESGEFPDTSNIESRMLPFCYEAGLVSGYAPDAAQFMCIATETFIKEALSAIFSRTRSNGPGELGSAGFGGNNWVQTRKYRRQLTREEESAMRGETQRDKMGLLPVEAKAAGERGPLGLAELRIALEMGDCGLTQFPVIGHSLMYNYHEGELENWDDYTWIDGGQDHEPASMANGTAGAQQAGSAAGSDVLIKTGGSLTNGAEFADFMDVDSTEMWWEGADTFDGDLLNGVLDSCLAVG